MAETLKLIPAIAFGQILEKYKTKGKEQSGLQGLLSLQLKAWKFMKSRKSILKWLFEFYFIYSKKLLFQTIANNHTTVTLDPASVNFMYGTHFMFFCFSFHV